MAAKRVLKRDTSKETARVLAASIRLIEDEMRLVTCHIRGINLASADKIGVMHDRLRAIRYQIEIEAKLDDEAHPRGWS